MVGYPLIVPLTKAVPFGKPRIVPLMRAVPLGNSHTGCGWTFPSIEDVFKGIASVPFIGVVELTGCHVAGLWVPLWTGKLEWLQCGC